MPERAGMAENRMQTELQRRVLPGAGRAFVFPSRVYCIVIATLALAFSQVAWAQKDAASIVGTVKDPSGAVVAGAHITITDVDRGVSFVAPTDGSGNYVASPLRIGHYIIKVAMKNFKTAIIGPVNLQLGQRLEVNVSLARSHKVCA